MKRKERVMVTVIDNEELPKAFPSLEDLRGGHRALTPEQKAELRELIRSMTLEAPDGWGERSFKELLERG